MYKLERARRYKFVFCALTVVFFVLCILGYGGGGYEMVWDGFVDNELAAIVMVVSLFSAIICLLACLTINALEKDIAEWLKIVESRAKKGNP